MATKVFYNGSRIDYSKWGVEKLILIFCEDDCLDTEKHAWPLCSGGRVNWEECHGLRRSIEAAGCVHACRRFGQHAWPI